MNRQRECQVCMKQKPLSELYVQILREGKQVPPGEVRFTCEECLKKDPQVVLLKEKPNVSGTH